MYYIYIWKTALNISHKLYSIPLSKMLRINKYSSNIEFSFFFKQNCASYDFPIFLHICVQMSFLKHLFMPINIIILRRSIVFFATN